MQDPDFKEKVFKSSHNRLSKLHKKLRIALNLEEMGFLSEQRVGRYFADELHYDFKIIVEIFGDYTHANPALFNDDYLIRLRGQEYVAKDKRRLDEKRLMELREMGYNVIVIWESDDLEEKRKEIEEIIKKIIL